MSLKQYDSSSSDGGLSTPPRHITGSRESLTKFIPPSPRTNRDRIPPRSPPGSADRIVTSNLPYSTFQRYIMSHSYSHAHTHARLHNSNILLKKNIISNGEC